MIYWGFSIELTDQPILLDLNPRKGPANPVMPQQVWIKGLALGSHNSDEEEGEHFDNEIVILDSDEAIDPLQDPQQQQQQQQQQSSRKHSSVRVMFGDREANVVTVEHRSLIILFAPERPDFQQTTVVPVTVFNLDSQGNARESSSQLQYTYNVPQKLESSSKNNSSSGGDSGNVTK